MNQYYRNVINAYKQVNRELFVSNVVTENSIDDNLPIGYDQTMTQTKIVLGMLIECKIENTNRILEIGTGSGYQTLLLSLLCKEVYTVEIIKELSISAKERIDLWKRDNIYYLVGDGTHGWRENAPYDRILISACCATVPHALFQQLDINGIMIVPVGNKYEQKLVKYMKLKGGKILKTPLYSVSFVELKGENGWK